MDSFSDALGDFLSRLSPGFILEDPRKVQSALYIVFLALFVIALGAGIIMAAFSRRLSKGHRVHRRLLDRYGMWLGWLGGVGIIIIALRYADVQMFSKRLWTVLDLYALLAVGIHFVLYRIRQYDTDIAEYEEIERRRRHLPTSRGGRAARRRR